jgi:tetratricopeptide (TPR) repeat protein
VVLDRQGLDQAAMTQYQLALERDPTNVQARVHLADAKMRIGRAEDAAALYRQALEQVPESLRIQLSLTMANVKAGHYGMARAGLELALKAHPGAPEIINTLARILATAPDAAVRDGPRALELARTLFEARRDPDVGQTYAMALAETGDFEQAAGLQRETIIVSERMVGESGKSFLQKNLARYEQRKPSREGWAADDPVFQPRSPAAQLAKAPHAS